MQAIAVDDLALPRLAVRPVADPTPREDQALVRVEAVSLNPGELHRALSQASAGWVPGWDFAGVVERPAASGQGPAAGARVVGFSEHGAWAEQVCAAPGMLATLPDGIPSALACTLPVAGLTALYSLAEGGLLAGQRVLVNGASGGVGHLAVQLAAASGAEVIAAVRRESQRAAARADGAHTVIVSDALEGAQTHGPYDLILESSGGPALARAMGLLAPRGVCVSFGNASASPVRFEPFDFLLERTRLIGFYLLPRLQREPAGPGLARLLRLVERGMLRPRIALEAPWTEISAVAQRLLQRGIQGKAVLRIG